MSFSQSGNSVANTTAYTKFEAPSDRRVDDGCCGLCCFKGCILGAIGLAYFFLIIPTGILLIFHGMNKDVNLTIGLGAMVLTVPTCVVIPACFLCNHYSRKWKEKNRENRDKKKTYQFDNPFKSETELQL